MKPHMTQSAWRELMDNPAYSQSVGMIQGSLLIVSAYGYWRAFKWLFG